MMKGIRNLPQMCISFLLLLMFVYLFILQIRASWAFTIDDMYITLRYAKHWFDGTGLLWNNGELPVEGYSNFSFVVLGRVALEWGLDPVLILKTTGVLGLGLSCVALYALSRFWFRQYLAFIPSLWLLAYSGEILWSVSGLETSVYQALILFAVFFIFKGLGYEWKTKRHEKIQRKIKPGAFIIAGCILALASLTRPEAPALVLLFTVLIYTDLSSSSLKHRRHALMLFCAAFLLCFIPYFCWRWSYYGRLFPNPVYCKGMSASQFVLDIQYLKLIWPFLLLSSIAMIKAPDRRHYFLWLPSVVYCLLLIKADPIVAFQNRLFLPAFALFLPLALQGMYTIISTGVTEPRLLRSVTQATMSLETRFKFPLPHSSGSYFPAETKNGFIYLVALLWAFVFIPMKSLAGYDYFAQNPVMGEELRNKVVAWLEQHTTSTTRVVLADSGLIPYRSALQFTDSYCLNNSTMSKNSNKMMYQRFCDEIFIVNPEVIILTALIEKGRIVYTPADVCLAVKLASMQNYTLQASLSTPTQLSSYRYEIYQRKPYVMP